MRLEGVQEGPDLCRICLWPNHVDVWQKPTQYYKAIILQLKLNTFKNKKKVFHIPHKYHYPSVSCKMITIHTLFHIILIALSCDSN